MYHLLVESKKKKNDKKELIYKTEIDPQTQKTNLPMGKEWGRDELIVWD